MDLYPIQIYEFGTGIYTVLGIICHDKNKKIPKENADKINLKENLWLIAIIYTDLWLIIFTIAVINKD